MVLSMVLFFVLTSTHPRICAKYIQYLFRARIVGRCIGSLYWVAAQYRCAAKHTLTDRQKKNIHISEMPKHASYIIVPNGHGAVPFPMPHSQVLLFGCYYWHGNGTMRCSIEVHMDVEGFH